MNGLERNGMNNPYGPKWQLYRANWKLHDNRPYGNKYTYYENWETLKRAWKNKGKDYKVEFLDWENEEWLEIKDWNDE